MFAFIVYFIQVLKMEKFGKLFLWAYEVIAVKCVKCLMTNIDTWCTNFSHSSKYYSSDKIILFDSDSFPSTDEKNVGPTL